MDKKLIVFENTSVEVIMVDGEPYFELYAVGAALGYTRVTVSKGKEYFQIRKDRIDKTMRNAEITGLDHGGTTYLNEEMIYEFMFEAKTEKCKSFRKWLAHEVLPAIRKDGMYVNGEEEVKSVEELQELITPAMERKILRKFGIGVRKDMTKLFKENWGATKGYEYAMYTNELIYKPLFGKTAKELKADMKIKNLRDDYFSEEDLFKIANLETEIANLIEFGGNYKRVKEHIYAKYKIVPVEVKEEKPKGIKNFIQGMFQI